MLQILIAKHQRPGVFDKPFKVYGFLQLFTSLNLTHTWAVVPVVLTQELYSHYSAKTNKHLK